MNGISHATLSEVCRLVTDGTHDTPKRVDEGYPLIKAKEIVGGQIDFATCDQISKADHLKVISRSKPERGDTLFAHIGASLGEAAYVGCSREFSIKNIALFKPDTSKIDGRYLYYVIIGPAFQGLAKGSRTGSAQPFLSLGQLRGHPISFHADAGTQRRIASILSAYDDLIENNTRRIAILEEMARRIYEEWFVRFRFPGHENVRMIESELGLVPEGWSIRGLYDVADLTYGFPFKSKLFTEGGEGLRVIRIRDIRDDYTGTRTTEDADPKYLVADGDILVGMDGAFHMGRWAGGVAWLNQRVVRFRPKDGVPRSWLFWATEEPIKTLEATIVGTTVAHLSARDLKEMRVLVPPEATLKVASSLLEPMSDLELTLKKKNANLRATRDLLLPKLISGELDVSAMPELEAIAA